ncbi:hypothetical protein CYMTET_54088 [Cymbomonas tetramitiformis]|uniref:Secreted protein n=1 Tax=Cymbomonas tetramitiformis TaxID=36881 RepID=A0AAE0BH24_9CHLO|nr:hypothetical protein CYMTET_54088 [Cymbomonas tetramitiformis]
MLACFIGLLAFGIAGAAAGLGGSGIDGIDNNMDDFNSVTTESPQRLRCMVVCPAAHHGGAFALRDVRWHTAGVRFSFDHGKIVNGLHFIFAALSLQFGFSFRDDFSI